MPGILRDLAEEKPVSEVLGQVDAAASGHGHGSVRAALTEGGPRHRDAAPSTLSLAIFATSVSLHALLRAEGLRPDALVGHSQGEITALIAGGWLSVEDGLRLLCEREVLLGEHSPPGGLLAVELGARRTGGLVALLGDATAALAADNAPKQTVLSASEDGLAAAQKVLAAVDVHSTRLRAPYPFHGPLLAGVTELFRAVVDTVEFTPGHTPVLSPILGRAVESPADARAVVRDHLVRPVRFRAAVSEALADGVERFVECGAKSTLVDLTRQNAPGSTRFVAPLVRRVSKSGLRALFDDPGDEPAPAGPPAPRPTPEVAPAPVAVEPATRAPQQAPEVAPAPAVEPAAPETAPAAPPARTSNGSAPASAAAGRLPETGVLVDELRQIFAETLGYPLDVLTDDVDLEADLGISSVKQIELFTTILDRYNLPTPSADVRPGLFPTLPDIAAFLRELDRTAAAAA